MHVSINADRHSDKTGERFLHLTAPWWVAILGYIIAVSTFSTGGRYFSMFLMASGYAGNDTSVELYTEEAQHSLHFQDPHLHLSGSLMQYLDRLPNALQRSG